MTWGAGYQFIGTDGRNGSNANVTWDTVRSALSSAAALRESVITIDSMGAPNIYGGNIYGSNIYAGNPDGNNPSLKDYFAKMSSSGFEIYHSDIVQPKMSLGVDNSGRQITIRLGAGGNSSALNIFEIQKGIDNASCIYTTPTGAPVGFQFNSNGTITIYGDIALPTVFS